MVLEGFSLFWDGSARVCLVLAWFCKGLLGFGMVLQGFAWFLNGFAMVSFVLAWFYAGLLDFTWF